MEGSGTEHVSEDEAKKNDGDTTPSHYHDGKPNHVDTNPGWGLYDRFGLQSDWDAIMSELGLNKNPLDLKPTDLVGTGFASYESADLFYHMYSAAMGFGVRKGALRLDVRGQPINRTWLCCKEGTRDTKYLNLLNRVRTARGITREQCPALLRVNLNKKTGRWFVTAFVTNHSHPLASTPCVQFMRDKRVVSDGAKTTVRNLRNSGIRTTKIMSYLAQQVGGYDNVRFLVKDLYNKLGKESSVLMADGDASRAIGYLQSKADNDIGFYAKYSYDMKNRLQNLFWADSKARADYGCFGDVLSFDSTYKINQYGKPLLVFIGVTNHFRSTVFGYAVLIDKTTDTYTWALSAFLDCMNGVCPTAVITYGDLAMRAAIVELMPNSVHRLCAWHIENNVVSNVKAPGFITALKKFMFRCYSEDEFERCWAKDIGDMGLEGNTYVQQLYGKRQLWADTYLRDNFFAGMNTTQRCEKMNAFLKSKVMQHMTLEDFLRGIDMANSWLRHKQSEDEYKSVWMRPVTNVTNLFSLEEEAAQIYTPSIFYKVQKELQREGKYIVTWLEVEDGNVRSKLTKYADVGYPCRHIFSTMKALHVDKLPDSLVKDRWRRTSDAQKSSGRQGFGLANEMFTVTELRFGHMTSKCSELAQLASRTSVTFDFAHQSLCRLTAQLQEMLECVDLSAEEEEKSFHKGSGLNNPAYSRTKGGWTGSRKGGKGTKKCSICHTKGHNKATCRKTDVPWKRSRASMETDEVSNASQSEGMTGQRSRSIGMVNEMDCNNASPSADDADKESQEFMDRIGKGWWGNYY